LYGDLGLRRFADLDLLVERKDRARALEVLGPAGYHVAGGLSNTAAAVIYAGVGAWPLAHADGFPLDLHWRPQAARFGSPLDSAEVLRDGVVSPLAGRAVRMASPTHAATLTLLHAAKHLWTSLELVLSIAHLMRRDDVDWPRVRALTVKADAWSGASAGLFLAGEIFARGPFRAFTGRRGSFFRWQTSRTRRGSPSSARIAPSSTRGAAGSVTPRGGCSRPRRSNPHGADYPTAWRRCTSQCGSSACCWSSPGASCPPLLGPVAAQASKVTSSRWLAGPRSRRVRGVRTPSAALG